MTALCTSIIRSIKEDRRRECSSSITLQLVMPHEQSYTTVSHFIGPSWNCSGAAQTVRLGDRAHLVVVYLQDCLCTNWHPQEFQDLGFSSGLSHTGRFPQAVIDDCFSCLMKCIGTLFRPYLGIQYTGCRLYMQLPAHHCYCFPSFYI